MRKLIPVALATVLVAAWAHDTTIPNEVEAQTVAAANDQVMPGRGGMFQRLSEEGDSITLALLDRADLARQKMREARLSGDTAAARIRHLEAGATCIPR